jgi:hypothetical protein
MERLHKLHGQQQQVDATVACLMLIRGKERARAPNID